MALDFVSPDNIQECVRLTEEFRLLPKNHRAKEDKLEVPLSLYVCVLYSSRSSFVFHRDCYGLWQLDLIRSLLYFS